MRMATMRAFFVLVALLAFCSAAAEAKKRHRECSPLPPGRYNTQSGPKEGILNVHLVPHTHDDVGWLKTVDQYFIGSNSSIQQAGVQYILDSIVANLAESPDRKFVYVEQAFFQRWWRQQRKETQELVRHLVKAGQLEFINGGWCMHDEATTHYVDMIDQTTLGHRYIKEQFKVTPRVGWQIDPFGHSAVQASLLSAEVGFDGLFFGRADWADILERRKTKTMEMIWRGSKSLGASAEVFTGVLGNHYDAPVGYNYDTYWQSDPIQDDCRLYDVNVQERVDTFVKDNLRQASQFKTNHIMLTMGADFTYSNAHQWYKNMDKLIHHVNKDGRVNAFYSTPSIYLDAKHAANETWPLKTDDFFPYSDCQHCFWTGYFTSRPALKGYVRALSGYLQAARQLEVFAGRSEEGPNTDLLEEAVAIAQHHDAVSGTEKQHVADDYAKRLAIGAAEAEEVVNAALVSLLEGGRKRHFHEAPGGSLAASGAASSLHARALLEKSARPGHVQDSTGTRFDQCRLLNVSYCPATETEFTVNKTLVVIAYNPLGWARTEMVRLPVTTQAVLVSDREGKTIPSQVRPLDHVTRKLRAQYSEVSNEATYELAFLAAAPPLGAATYFVAVAPAGTAGVASVVEVNEVDDVSDNGWVLKAQNEHFGLTFSAETGRLVKIDNHKSQVSLAVIDQNMLWYNASDGNVKPEEDVKLCNWRGCKASGAYIFRPNESDPFPMWDSANHEGPKLTVARGPLMTEVRQEFAPWAHQVFRVFKDAVDAQVEFTVGPIPIDNDLGKEVISRLEVGVENGATFYTDSNGRDMIKRVVNHRDDWNLTVYEPVAGNYYPVNAAISLRDEKAQLTLLTDRSLGGASLKQGQVELMLHRRLLHDDARGVGEALNETTCTGGDKTDCQGLVVRGVYHLGVDTPAGAPRWQRQLAQRLYSPLQLVFAITEGAAGGKEWLQTHQGAFSAMPAGSELPPNVALLTLQELEDGKVLLRLAHLFEVGEDEEYSKMATVDLTKLFANRKIEDVTELSLSANQRKAEMKRLKWRVEGDTETSRKAVRGKALSKGSRVVELGPMEIRTFGLRFGAV